jgi:CRISPR-associated endonuclease/helicase Cas3
VGNKRKFNSEGIVAVNSTAKEFKTAESQWDYLPVIRAFTALAALLHDWGKATKVFQKKLKPNYCGGVGDPIRHEWISCVILDAFIRHCNANDRKWLEELALGNVDEDELKKQVLNKPEKLFVGHDSVAQMLMWLIVSHHRLPLPKGDLQTLKDGFLDVTAESLNDCLIKITQVWGYENRKDEADFQKRLAGCFEFPSGFLGDSSKWLRDVKRWAKKLALLNDQIEALIQGNAMRLVLHHARLCLMLGDHHYSSLPKCEKWQSKTDLFANTDRKTGVLKQRLDEHLVGVKKYALDVVNLLPLVHDMEQEDISAVFDNRALRKPSVGDFSWQQKAVNTISAFKKQESLSGAFVVNMASTGCGKTFANAKIMQALSPQGNSLRYVLALGLRTLTLQTGDEYRERVGLGSDELAVLIGSKAVSELHNHDKQTKLLKNSAPTIEAIGSESLEALLDNDIDFSGVLPDSSLSTVLNDERARQFLYAPVLACTIDHMMGATETKRGGRYILPSLRLLSSDLVIDEVDDFTGEDLAAIGRLVHMAGMLGRKVMISSATIPPALAEGFFNAYRLGWKLFSQSQNKPAAICSVWIDEFNSVATQVNASENGVEHYKNLHAEFIQKRVEKLVRQPAKRKANIVECPLVSEEQSVQNDTLQERYFNIVWQAALIKHAQHYSVDAASQKRVSFGVIRVANIPTCVDLTRFLLSVDLPEDTNIFVMAYHSQQVLLMRHTQEQHLDAVLKRKEKQGEQPQAFGHPIIRKHLASASAKDCLFILVATPVEEVGRDHDFDWAVLEPSSYRSIIQLAGRVRRHRLGEVKNTNVALLQYNWRAFKDADEKRPYFVNPGYEERVLPNHDLAKLIDISVIEQRLDAVPRISAPTQPVMNQLFAGIEHKATKQLLTEYNNVNVSNIQGYLNHAWWLTALPQMFQSFRRSKPAETLFYVWDEKKQCCYWAEKDDDGRPVKCSQRLGIQTTTLTAEQEARLWLHRDYETLLMQWAQTRETTLEKTSLRYGELSLTIYNDTDTFEYSPQLGIYRLGRR